MTHLGLGDNITAIGAVRYLSTCYDKVFVVCKEKNKKNMELFYDDDKTIEIYPVICDKYISPRKGFDINTFKNITKNMDLYLAGSHCLIKHPEPYTDLPFNFYRDMNINEKYFWQYFHVNISSESKSLFNKLKGVSNYIFIHNSASTGNAFSIVEIENKLKFNKQEILVINPNNNIYNRTEPFFELANEFLNHPFTFLYINYYKCK